MDLRGIAFRDQDLTFKDADFGIVLINPSREHADDAGIGSRARFTFIQYLGIGIQGISGKDRRGQLDFFPPQVSNRRLAYI